MISFVGAGPGAPDLLTIRARDRLEAANIVIWASSLVPEEILEVCREDAMILDSAGMTLEDVIGVYEANPDACIVRLHSGDPSVYGAIGEQIEWCKQNDRDFEIVPGVSSFSASAAILARELTVPKVSQSIVLTRLAGRTANSVPDGESLERYAAVGGSLCIFLAGARPRELQDQLLGPTSVFTPQTPAAVFYRATWPDEIVVETTIGELAETIRSIGKTVTVLVLVGEALGNSGARSHLYSPDYAHRFRNRSVAGSTAGRPSARLLRERAGSAPTDENWNRSSRN